MCPRRVEHFVTYVRFQRGECGSAIIINTHNRSAASSESQTRKCSRVTPPPPLLSGIHTLFLYCARVFDTECVCTDERKRAWPPCQLPSLNAVHIGAHVACCGVFYIYAHMYIAHILKALAHDTTCAFFLVRAARTTIRTARCRCVRKLFSTHVCWLH